MASRRALLATGVAGLVLGASATLAVAALGDDGSARWSCDGAQVVAAATIDEGRVVVQVTVRDDRSRDWEAETGSGGTFPLTGDTGDVVLPSLSLLTGDLDDGTLRRVAVRPVGADRWCRGAVDAT